VLRRCFILLLAIALSGCGEDAWMRAGLIMGSLGMAALAGATGGSSGPGGAFDPQRYDPGRDARYNHEAPPRGRF
jgi:hypothetical protein